LRSAAGGPANWSSRPFAECGANLEALVARLAPEDAGGPDCLALCAASYAPERMAAEVTAWAKQRWPTALLRLETDLRSAHAAAFGREAGVVVIAGTGSVAYGRAVDGREARAGGRGALFGDGGSGAWLGRMAIRAVAEAEDGLAPETALRATLVATIPVWGAPGEPWLRGLIAAGPDAHELGLLAPAVLEAAAAGDGVAKGLLRAGAAELGRLALGVNRRLGEGLPIAVSGGMFTPPSPLLAHLGHWLEARGVSAAIRPAGRPPEAGALLLAAEMAGADAVRVVAAQFPKVGA